MNKPKLIVVLGPTSSGKTDVTVDIAKKYNGEAVCADSRQVYRGMDLGTGKVTKEEAGEIPHYLIDVADPKKPFSISDYMKLAEAAIADIHARGKIPILSGGTGFYIDTLINGIVLPEVPPNTALRKKLTGKSAAELLKKLQKLDPKRAKTIEQTNPVRLIRAIEIATALGKVPTLKKKPVPYQVLKIGLDMPDEILRDRITIRLGQRIEEGMLNEAKRLHTKGLSWVRMRSFGLEYRAMANLLTKKITREEFEKNLAMDIWHYAKRQRVWFKRDKEILWFNPLKKSDVKKMDSAVKSFLK